MAASFGLAASYGWVIDDVALWIMPLDSSSRGSNGAVESDGWEDACAYGRAMSLEDLDLSDGY